MTGRTIRVAALALALAGTATGALAQAGRWLPAWGSAQMLAGGKDADAIAAAGPATIRQVVHLSAGGRTLRVRLSNVAGDQPLRIGAASVATSAGPGRAEVSDAHALSFAGARDVTIPPGAELYSDPVPLAVAVSGDLAVSLYLPDPVAHRTGHPGARATTWLVAGDRTGDAALGQARKIGGWWSLADVEVTGSPQTGTVVAIGDSITDGHGVIDDTNARWTDVFARRLAADPATRRLSVVNAGIGGNRVLLDGLGPNLLARFDRDVIARPGVRYAIVLEGVNDLGVLTRDHPVSEAEHHAVVAAITGAYRQMVERAHAHGIRVIGGTITPYAGNDYYHPAAASEADRQAINAFVRTSGVFDGVVDFDRAVRDPAQPDHLLPAYDSGDHLHPGPTGYRAMGEAIPLALFGTATMRHAVLGAAAVPPVGPAPMRPQIALTFDDIPAHGPLPAGGDRLAIARTIVAALAAHHAPAFGFLNKGFGIDDPESPRVIAAWRAAGLPLGNHSYAHVNLDQVGPAAFLADVHRNEPALAAAMSGADWHWFRYPFLAEGHDAASVAAVRAGLRAGGYRIAAVTMSFGDYAWNDAYARCVAKGDGATIGGLEASYLAAARAQALRSRTLAHGALGRDVPYVLLMHLGAFDARMLPRLLSLYEGMGFGFTTLPAAEADPFYAAATDLALPGPSPTLEAAARARNVPVPPNAPLPAPRLCA
jgi:lysophospholipase L1-like esterase/peptidoglycan/xylan/chitin deacetylase (PgdA/CDA1 family)